MKIAVISDDGKTISQHFGRAQYYIVCTIENDKIVNRDQREKLGHNHFSHDEHGEHNGADHGMDEEHHNRHAQMAGSIADCQVLICGGMGMGAYESMRRLNITPVVTDIIDIDTAVNQYIKGNLIDQTEKLH